MSSIWGYFVDTALPQIPVTDIMRSGCFERHYSQ